MPEHNRFDWSRDHSSVRNYKGKMRIKEQKLKGITRKNVY